MNEALNWAIMDAFEEFLFISAKYNYNTSTMNDLSLTTIKRKIRQLVHQKWQREWNGVNQDACQVHNLFPTISTKLPTERTSLSSLETKNQE